jgi:hypothetical protein
MILYFIGVIALVSQCLKPALTPMNNSISAPRPTLKLKAGARKPTLTSAAGTSSVSPPDKRAKQKPGAQWSDEYKARMQAEMDALRTR